MLRRIDIPGLLSDAACAVVVLFDLDFANEGGAQGVELPSTLTAAAPKRQAEFMAGRYAAREALRELGVPDAVAPAMAADRRPVWPEGVVGSITHTDGLAWAAVARRGDRRGLGIDSETIRSVDIANEIRSVVLNEDESAVLRASIIPRWGEAAAICLALGAKESVYKCLSGSVASDLTFGDAILVATDLTAGQLRFQLTRPLSAELPAGHDCVVRFRITPPHLHTAMEWSGRPALEK